MAELLEQIPALAGVEPVRSIKTPAQLDYRFTAGAATSRTPGRPCPGSS